MKHSILETFVMIRLAQNPDSQLQVIHLTMS